MKTELTHKTKATDSHNVNHSDEYILLLEIKHRIDFVKTTVKIT